MRCRSRYLLITAVVLATVGADVAVFSLNNGFATTEAIAIGTGMAHVGITAAWAVRSRWHLWSRGLAMVSCVLAIAFAIDWWSRPPLELGHLSIAAAFFAGWAVLAGSLTALLDGPPHPTSVRSTDPGTKRRQFRVTHLLVLTTLLAVVLALTRPLSVSGGRADFILLSSAAVFLVCLLPQRLLASSILRVSLSAVFLLGAYSILAAVGGPSSLTIIGFVLFQGVLYTIWLEVILRESSSSGSNLGIETRPENVRLGGELP